ncbi:MAG: hypothetical protein ACRC46_03580 [Thermoguttaceae bacterium]
MTTYLLKLQSITSIATKILFEISDKTSDTDRRTSEMIAFDLAAAHKKWIAEADTEKERREREDSDFLRYENSEGKFADFHGLRHTFIRKRAASPLGLPSAALRSVRRPWI